MFMETALKLKRINVVTFLKNIQINKNLKALISNLIKKLRVVTYYATPGHFTARGPYPALWLTLTGPQKVHKKL